MKSLNLKKYCVIGLGNVTGLTKMLSNISETDVAYVSGSGLIIATFQTAFNIVELENLFKEDDKSYIIFEMTPGFYSANLKDKKFQDTLFGGDIDNTQFTKNIISNLEKLMDFKIEFVDPEDINFEEIVNKNKLVEKLSVDDILDKISQVGYEKLTDGEKKFLEKYSQSK